MKRKVAEIEFYEYLANGTIVIGSLAHEQDWDKILASFGYDRDEYTYSCDCLEETKENEFITRNTLTIYEKEER